MHTCGLVKCPHCSIMASINRSQARAHCCTAPTVMGKPLGAVVKVNQGDHGCARVCGEGQVRGDQVEDDAALLHTLIEHSPHGEIREWPGGL